MLPSDQYQATFVVSRPSNGVATVTEQVSECTFSARVGGRTIEAAQVECAIARDAAVRRQWGLSRRRYESFRIDAERGTWHASTASWQELQEGTVQSCAVAEGRLVTFTRTNDR
jgi:hypothetical protein